MKINKNKRIRRIVWNRLCFSIAIIFLIRFGTFLPIPGVKPSDLAFYIQRHSVTESLIRIFTGENTFVVGLFTLNIFPYINATILVQLLVAISPKLANLKKEGDLESRSTINRLTRSVTLVLALFQSLSISLYLKQILFNWNYILGFEIIIWLTTGTMIILWLSELITEYGLGNGSSLLIYASIIANFPNFYKKALMTNESNISAATLFEIILVILISLYGIIFLQEGVRKIPLISARQLNQFSVQKNVDYYIPLRFNQAGVMPIILATTFLVLPNAFINLGLFPSLSFLSSLKFLYWGGYFSLILLSSAFYSEIVINPKELSGQLQKMTVIIEGVRPGLETTFYLQRIIKRITLIGSSILAIIAIMPNFIGSTLSINGLAGLSTTSLLILAGVILDLIQEINNIYYSNIYNSMDK